MCKHGVRADVICWRCIDEIAEAMVTKLKVKDNNVATNTTDG